MSPYGNRIMYVPAESNSQIVDATAILIAMAHPKSLLLAFTIATIASNMSRYVDDLAVLYSIIGRDAIELTAFAIFCHNLVARPFAGIP